ncbi:MAG: hypothetical protein ACJAZO_004815 [Myxococcota bacterium]|jgi:hypothetical protein
MSHTLQSVLDAVSHSATQGTLPVVVFDLDSTLFSTRPRNLRILREFAATVPEHAALQAIVPTLVPDDFAWDVTLPLTNRGLNDAALFKDLSTYWFERFFTSEYVQSDTPTLGSVTFVQAVHDRGGFVYYLTGRDVHGMAQGTVASLTANHFPYWRGRTSLHLKPSFEMDDTEYKRDALNDIRSHFGPVIATFENEPKNANMFRAAFPEGAHFLLQTEHSPDPEPLHAEIVEIPDFRLA